MKWLCCTVHPFIHQHEARAQVKPAVISLWSLTGQRGLSVLVRGNPSPAVKCTGTLSSTFGRAVTDGRWHLSSLFKQNQRISGWFGLEGTSEIQSFHPCRGQGPHPSERPSLLPPSCCHSGLPSEQPTWRSCRKLNFDRKQYIKSLKIIGICVCDCTYIYILQENTNQTNQ